MTGGCDRRRSHPWCLLGSLGALLALGTLFVHVPAALWAGNVGEFHFRFARVLTPGLAAVLTGTAGSVIALWLLPRRARAVLACLIAAVGLVCWMNGTFFVGEMTALDGVNAPMHFRTPHPVGEVARTIGLCLAIAVLVGLIPRPAALMMLALNIGLGATTVAAVHGARDRATRPFGVPAADDMYRYSPRRNVLVVLLDGLQADVTADVFEHNPSLTAAFDGFEFFTDTVGVAPTTFLSLPALHSGAVFQNQDWLGTYFTEAIAQHSFVNRFAEAGYHTTLINPVEGICPERTAICTSGEQILRSPDAQLRIDRLRLLDLSLFRVAPRWLKRHVYNDGRWLMSGRQERPNDVDASAVNRSFDVDSQLLDGLRLIHEIAARVEVGDGPPTFKFFHSFVTHPPYALASNCQPAGTLIEHLPWQARCALAAVAALLEQLKQAGVYDNTVVLILADHGVNPDMGYQGMVPQGGELHDGIASLEEWRLLAGAAHPTFLLKPLNGRGPLRTAPGAVHLPDVGATLCAATGDCSARGIPAGHGAPDRPRRFNEYVWHHEFWELRDLPDLTPYEVRGPIWRIDSWRRASSDK